MRKGPTGATYPAAYRHPAGYGRGSSLWPAARPASFVRGSYFLAIASKTPFASLPIRGPASQPP